MHKCAVKGCNEQIPNKYKVCFKHLDTNYYDVCKIHGRTLFNHYQCLKCKKLKQPEYIITKKNNKYYGRKNKLLPKDYYLKPFYDRFLHLNRKYQEPFMGNVTDNPGVYGIFVKDNRYKNGLGECIYVGQSKNMRSRVNQHKEAFKKAQRQIKGTRVHKKNASIKNLNHKTEYKYYKMADKYKLSQLKFVSLFKLNKNLFKQSDLTIKEVLTYCEQAMITSYAQKGLSMPKYNTMAARPAK